MELTRRSFLKLAGITGATFVIPGLTITDIIPKTGQKSISQIGECRDFGKFLASVINNKGTVSMPKRFAWILGRTAKKAGILGRLKRERLVVPLGTSEALLEDNVALGDFAWQQLNEEISYQRPKRFEQSSNNAKDMLVKVDFTYDVSAFRFTIRAI